MTVGTFVENDATEGPGTIQLWAGSPSDIPAGWAICDGNNGTPNLLGEFVKAINSSETFSGQSGGQNSYTLSVGQLPSHNHSASIGTTGSHTHDREYKAKYDSGGDESFAHNNADSGSYSATENNGDHSHSFNTPSTGSSSSIDNQPAFQTVHFIMKL